MTYEIKRVDPEGNEFSSLVAADNACDALTIAKRLRPDSLLWQVLEEDATRPVLTDYPEEPQGRPFKVWIRYRSGSGESVDTVAPNARAAVALVFVEYELREDEVSGLAAFDLEISGSNPALVLN